ncbi:monocarboxylate transporter 10-like [Montipora capricornis]|uniref:monocarboxylate transporter 10-like n=1 Tax=Montipora capricornis TaxID=246305 RepID=UPI0035F10963
MAISQLFLSTGPPRKRDSLWSWLVCACAAMTSLSALGFVFSFGVFLPVFMDYFNASREITACIGSVGVAMTFFSGHISTALVTRVGCRITSIIGGVFCAISLLVSSFVDNLYLLLFTYSVLFGFGCSCTFSSGMVVINQYFNRRESIAMGILNLGVGGGILVMGPTLEALIMATGWRSTCRVMAVVVVILRSLVITFDPNVEANEEITHEETASGNTSLISKIKKVFDFSVWKEPPVIAFFIPAFLLSFGHFVPLIHMIRYSEELGVSAEKASRLFIYQGLCSSAGRLLSGFLCNHPRVDTFKVYQAAQFTAGLSIVLMTAAPTFATLTICMVFYGLGDGFFNTSLSVLTFTASPLKSAAVLGWRMTMSALFMASGPTLAGLLADKLGSYVVPFRVAGSITLSGAFIPFILLCYKRPDLSSSVNEEEERLLKYSAI